jgi:hypothetical protein
VIGTSVRQQVAPPERQSTVHATARVLTSSAIPLGSFAGGLTTGLLAGLVGQPAALVWVIAAGGLCIAAAVLLLPSGIPGRSDR